MCQTPNRPDRRWNYIEKFDEGVELKIDWFFVIQRVIIRGHIIVVGDSSPWGKELGVVGHKVDR